MGGRSGPQLCLGLRRRHNHMAILNSEMGDGELLPCAHEHRGCLMTKAVHWVINMWRCRRQTQRCLLVVGCRPSCIAVVCYRFGLTLWGHPWRPWRGSGCALLDATAGLQCLKLYGTT